MVVVIKGLLLAWTSSLRCVVGIIVIAGIVIIAGVVVIAGDVVEV